MKFQIFPPFMALILAFEACAFVYPDWLAVAVALARISSTLVPVQRVAAGLQWRLAFSQAYLSPLVLGLLYILLI